MSLRTYANAPATTLASSCSSGATSIILTSVTGLPITYPYILILDKETASEEVVLVTAAAGTTLTVTRGYDSTSAFSHGVGASVVHGISAIDPREANAHVNASSAVHGITGSVVGTSDSQTLTNKTLTTPTIASLTNAQHNHTNAAGGGQLTDAALSAAVTVAKGGTGATTLTSGNFLQGNGTSAVTATKAVPTGVVVGTTDAQTLTNKTLTSPAINGGTATGVAIDSTSTIGGGTTQGAWTSYTPTLTNITLGNGTLNCAYTQIGKTVHVRIRFVAGSTTTYSAGALTFSLPVTSIAVDSSVDCFGHGNVNNNSAASRTTVEAIPGSTTTVGMSYTGSNVSNTAPFTFGTSSRIGLNLTYEAA